MEGHLCVVVVERDGSGQTCAPSPPPPLKATLSDLTNNFTAPITFGCAASCTFRLRPTTGALERHAELRIERGKAVLYNLDSESRFVRVNKDAVSYHQPRSLEDGDTILLANGELCLQFGLPLDPPSSSSSPSLPSYSSKLLSSSSSSNKENQQPQKNTTNPSFASSLSFSSSSASCNVGNKGKIQRREHQHSSPDHSRRTTRVSSSFTTCSSFEEEINSPEDHNSHSGAMNGLLLPFCGKKEQQHKASLPSLLPPTAGRGPQTRDIGEMDPKQLMIMEEQQQDEQWDRASSALAAMASYKARSPSTPSPSSALQQLEDLEEQDDEEEHDDDGEEYEEAEHSSTSTLRSVRKEDNEHYIDYYDENDEIGEEVDEEEDKAWIRTKTSTTINNGSNERSDVGPPFTTFRIGVSDILREGMTGEFSIVRDPKSGALNFVLKIPTAFGYGSPASSNNPHYHNSRKVSHSFSDNKEDQETSVIPSVDEMKCTEQHQVTNVPTKSNSDETATTTTTSSSLTPRRSKRLRSSTLTTSTTNSTKHDMPSTKKTRPNNSANKKNATMKTTESPDSPTNARRPFKKRSTVRRGTHLRKDATKEQQEQEEVEEGEEEELLSNEVNEVSEEEEEGDEEERKNTIRTRRRSDASDTQEQSWMPTERKTKSVDRKGTLLWSAERVLREEGRPMKAPEIVEVGRRKGYIDTDSKRAANSLVGRFSTSIRQDPNSPFVRLSPATYGLKEHMEFYRLVRQGASSPN